MFRKITTQQKEERQWNLSENLKEDVEKAENNAGASPAGRALLLCALSLSCIDCERVKFVI